MFTHRFAGAAIAALGFLLLPINGADGQQVAPHEIQLDVDVTGPGGKPAPTLGAQDFTVLDNKTPRPISSFTVVQGKTAPVEVVVVIDSVNTPYTALGYQRDQIEKYLRNKGEALPFPTTFAILTDTSFKMFGESTTNGGVLANALNKSNIGLREINRAQGFYGASDRMTISLDALRQLTTFEEKRPGRKLVLWVSPGWPLLSGPEVELDDKEQNGVYQEAIDFATNLRKADITLYSLNSWGAAESVGRAFYYESFVDGLKRPSDAQLGNLGVQVLAEQSGGLVLNTSDVVGMMKQSVADGTSYYRLTFEPSPSDKPEEYHQVQVKLAAAGLKARTREGYYAQP